MNNLKIEVTPQKDFQITQHEVMMIATDLKEAFTRAKEEVERAYQVNIEIIEDQGR